MDKKKRFKASLLALALAVLPWRVDAAGLGRLTVVSALGQPLRAEIDLSVSREEYSSLTAKLASGDAFKNAGIEYSPALSGIRFKLDKRANGQAYLLATSDKSFNEPFVDMLVEVNWASGRLVREYTFLLDPPEVFKSPATPAAVLPPEIKAPVAAPVIAPPVAETPVVATKAPEAAPAVAARAPAAPAAPAKPVAVEPKPAQAAPAPKAPPAPSASAERLVKPGDTLAKIASEVKPEGVNLDQMLVALFRSNAEVFDSGNMNRLRAGKILTVPDKEVAAAIEPAEARKVVIAQATDFNAYRRKLAGMVAAEPAKAEAPKQAVTGKITPRVEDKVPAPPVGKDKLEVSRSETGKAGKSGERIAAVEEELIARDKALKEAKSRIQDLEKNLADLKRLAEMKGAAGAKPPLPSAPAKAPEAVKPAPALAVPATPVETPKPPAPAPVETKPAPPAPQPLPQPSFVEENPELVFGGGGILALLLAYLGYGAWRKKREAAGDADDSIGGDSFATKSAVVSTGALSVDTNAVAATDFDQESIAGAGSDEGVDPVAEADVYIAYGRDSQAEEILLEALKTDPTRCAIHLKLLEIYAARKSVQPFEAAARELYGLTNGSGPDWDKAAALGRSIDSQNPLYGGVDTPAPAQDFAEASMATQIMAAPVIAAPAEAPAAEPVVAEKAPESLDFDLDLGAEPETAPAVTEPAAEEVMSLDFDLDLGNEPAVAAEAQSPVEATDTAVDIDLGTPTVEAEAPQTEAPAVEPKTEEVAALDFDFNLGDKDEAPAAAPVAEPEMPALDLSAISLDLDVAPAEEISAPVAPPEAVPAIELPALEASPLETLALPEAEAEAPPPAPASPIIVEDDPEVATKLELAVAYEEMGDKEGARELLNEVLSEGSPAQQDAARNKLALLG